MKTISSLSSLWFLFLFSYCAYGLAFDSEFNKSMNGNHLKITQNSSIRIQNRTPYLEKYLIENTGDVPVSVGIPQIYPVGQLTPGESILLELPAYAFIKCINSYKQLAGIYLKKNKLDLLNTAEGIAHCYKSSQTELNEFLDPLLIEVHGASSKGEMISAEEMDQWFFIFLLLSDSSPNVYTLILSLKSGVFQEPVLVKQPWFGTVYDALPRNMSASEAVQLIQQAGYTQPFSYMAFRQPLTPMASNIFYIFEFPGMYVLVNSQTKEVFEEIPERISFKSPQIFLQKARSK